MPAATRRRPAKLMPIPAAATGARDWLDGDADAEVVGLGPGVELVVEVGLAVVVLIVVAVVEGVAVVEDGTADRG